MYTVFICLVGVNFVAQYVQDAMSEEMYGVSADDEVEYDPPYTEEDGMWFSKQETADAAIAPEMTISAIVDGAANDGHSAPTGQNHYTKAAN